MTEQVIPAVHERLDAQAAEIRKINGTVLKEKNDFGWMMRILAFALNIINAVSIAVIVWILKTAMHH